MYIEGLVTGYNFQKSIIYLSLKVYIAFKLANCSDPDGMPRIDFIWVFAITSVFFLFISEEIVEVDVTFE